MNTISRAATVIAAIVAVTALWQGPASAQGGPGGGGGLGGTTCGQGWTPYCKVTVGSPGGGGGPGSPGGPGGPGPVAGGPGPGCTPSSQFGCVPPGCKVTTQTVGCPFGPGGPPRGGRGPVLPPPIVLGRLAVRFLHLPDPVIRSSPAANAVQLTRLPTWLWMARAVWQPRSKTAHVPGESVTATATPVSASWRMGDGKTITCHGPGTAYTAADSPASRSPTCGYTYTRSSAGQPHAAYHVTAVITWDIRWTGPGGTGGVLPPLFTAAAAEMRVAESQAVNTGGGA